MTDEKTLTQKLTEALTALDSARATYDAAEERERSASHDLNACRNQLNDAQKRFDGLVAELRESAPWSTDWHQQRVHPVPVSGA